MWINYLDQALLMAALAVSVNLLVGYAGQVSVAHAAFAGIGGYTVAYLSGQQDWPFAASLLLSIALASAAGVLVGLIALELAEELLILMTMAFSLALIGVFATFDQLGGIMGLTGVTDLNLFGLALDGPADWLWPAAGTLVLVYAVCHRLGESPYGRVLKGVREDAVATRALGKSVLRAKLSVFAITSGLAGLAGGVYSGWLGQATPSAFSFPLAMTVFAMVIVGGNANLLGSVVAGMALTMVEPALRAGLGVASTDAALVQLVLYGALLVLVMALRPQGLFPERFRRMHPSTAESPSTRVRPPAASRDRVVPDGERPDVVLQAIGLSKRYGGIVAARDISLELRRGTITALVGPNGAGKTTAFNLLTGVAVPDSGQVLLEGVDLVGMRPERIVEAGVVRTFQDLRLFGRLTCLENVMLAVPDQPGERLSRLFVPGRTVARSDRRVAEKAMEWLAFVGLADEADTAVGDLSYGQTKMVSAARTLATEAPVMLLDEPASGVDSVWLDRLVALVADCREQGRTICLVEHNLDVVRQLADHTYFMELGKVTASGSLAELTSSAELAEAYFGAQ